MSVSKAFLQPLDRVAIALMLVLSLLIGLLLSQGDALKANVRNFSWQNQKIGADDNSFTLTFSRPVDRKSVEDNLKIEPPLRGKFSWSGRRMVYTLLGPAGYDTKYKVQLQGAKDRFTDRGDQGREIQPFLGEFHTRDRVVAYIGVEGEEQGRLVLYDFPKSKKVVLSPKDLFVVDFKPYPDGEKILFAATKRTNGQQDILSSQLYSVSTGISADPEKEINTGSMDLILNNKDYQNLKFELSADGKTIVVQRVSTVNPGNFGLWVLRQNDHGEIQAQPLKSQGGDFVIAANSQQVAIAEGQGVAIVSLDGDKSGTPQQTDKPLDFLPQFGMVQAFAKDGIQAAMVKFNPDYTRELFLVTNQGIQKSLLKTSGEVLTCQFDPASPTLYCLLTQLLPGEKYVEQPYLAAINLKTGEQKPLVILPNQRDVQMSLSPDGLALLFDQVQTDVNPQSANGLRTNDGSAIVSSHLWLMSLLPTNEGASPVQLKPEQLPLAGIRPRWLP